MREALERLYARHFGRPPVRVEPIAGDASPRLRYRLIDENGGRAIGVSPDVAEEDRAFLSFTRAFRRADLPVPELYAVDEPTGAYLVEDAGSETLHAALQTERRRSGEAFPDSMQALFEDAVSQLVRFQLVGGEVVDFRDAWPRADFDRRSMSWDLAWFKNMFLRLVEVPFDEDRLEDDFETLLACLLDEGEHEFLYRDFQPRNVMLTPDGLRFIDYQGGRRGPLPYDIASFLWSGSADLPEDTREALLGTYLDALAKERHHSDGAFRARVPTFAVLRIMQALGAYGYRGLHMRRPGFAARIGTAIRNLDRLLGDRHAVPDLPELRRAVSSARDREDLMGPVLEVTDGLVVRIGSFSYRTGIPRAPGGHGGGFVFDCRALPNPGLEPEHRVRSGLDPEVARVLEGSDAAHAFVAHARDLVEAQVRTYLEKGYTSLDVRFGCTGGQHRSVWCAEQVARALQEAAPDARILVDHAEASSWPEGAKRP